MACYSARVVRVTQVLSPKVAHEKGQWAIQVLIPVKRFNRIFPQKRWVYGNDIPEVGEWIEVEIIDLSEPKRALDDWEIEENLRLQKVGYL